MNGMRVVITGVAVLMFAAGPALAQRASKPGAVERGDSATEAPPARSLTAPRQTTPGATGTAKPDTSAKGKGEKKGEAKSDKKGDDKKK